MTLIPAFSDVVEKAGPKAGPKLIDGVELDIWTAEQQQGMGTTTMFGPGTPQLPQNGFGRHPRTQDFQTGYNIASRPRTNERVSFNALRSLIDIYDVAQMCISHRIDSIRALPWTIQPIQGVDGDLTREMDLARAFMKKPDGRTFFSNWLAEAAYDVLAFDAGTIYKQRNNAGQVIGLEVVDGTTIAPLLDDWGRRPTGDAPAYIQFVQGMNFNQLFDHDLIYTPFRPTSNSPYGRAPLESILINANTDLRFQQWFLQSFTAGNIPDGFGIAPDGWGPEQVTAYQKSWDALLYGDEEAQSQIKWVPGGVKFEFPTRKDFDDEFSLFLMKKTMASYHVTPADLGFTQDVNKSSGETQASVQERVGDIPLLGYFQTILDSVLQDDLGLPLEFRFDVGGEEEDRLQTAQSDVIYIDRAVVSVSEIRKKRFGLDEVDGVDLPRFIYTTHLGAQPLSSLITASGPTDPESGAPTPGTALPAQQTEVAAIAPSTQAAPAADQATAAVLAPAAQPVQKAAEQRDELAAFRSFRKARVQKGAWRPFQFATVDQATAHRLNTAGYAEVRKAAGELVAAGLAVLASDTGRVLLLQRHLDPTDPAGGMWEFPGGCLEPGETGAMAAAREWQEEVGVIIPAGYWQPGWVSPNGVYAGYVWVIESEAQVPPHMGRGVVLNPDDPDGDQIETVAWWAPAALVGNPVVRAELAADASLVLGALNGATRAVGGAVVKGIGDVLLEQTVPEGDVPFDVYDRGIVPPPFPDLRDGGQVELDPKAPSGVMKGWRETDPVTPQLTYDLPLTDHYAPLITAALLAQVDKLDVPAVIARFTSQVKKDDTDTLEQEIRAALASNDPQWADLRQQLDRVIADGYTAGEHAASVQLSAHHVNVEGQSQAAVDIDWGAWVPGDPDAALAAADGGMRDLLNQAGITVKAIGDTTLDQIGNEIAAGLERGDASDTIAKAITDLVGSAARADRIAHTEVARAVIEGTMRVYAASGIGSWDLVTSAGACAVCLSIEAANPHPTSDRSSAPPVHPYCRCSAAPSQESIFGATVTNTDDQEEIDG